uniref:Sugar transporter SWEET1 n=1 Tax=Plectus sambesii TaxID=2011161 RepID=A0A914V9L9_9BILA
MALSILGLLSITAVTSTMGLFFCGIPICLEIRRRKTSEGTNPAPFLMGALGGIFWLRYGFLKSDCSILTVNVVGVTSQILYLIYFYLYTQIKTLINRQLVAVVVSTTAMLPFEMVAPHLGFMCMVLNIANFGAPLTGLRRVITEKSCQSLPLPLCVANFLVSAQWFFYGFLVGDPFIIAPNAVGMALALIQLSLFIIFPKRPLQFIPNKRRLVERNRTKTFCCHYTNNGDTLLTASQDHMIRLYSTSGKRQRYVPVKQITAPNVGWSILDLVVSPDGRHAIYATWSEYIHQCKIDGEDPDWQAFNLFPPDYRFAVFSIRFSADGSEILAGASDRRLYIYDRQANRQSLSIDAHEDDVNAVCFGDEASNIIYSGADDGLCKVWDRRTLSEERPQPVGVLAGHMDGITFIDSKGDGRHLITNSKDQSIKLWDVRKFSSNEAQEETRTAVSRQSWDYRWHSVPRYARRTSRLEGDTSLMTYRGHTVLHTLIRAHFSPAHVTGQRYIYSGCARGHCIVYDMLTGKIVKKLEGHRSVVRDVSWHPYEMEMTTSSWDGETAVWRWDQRAKRNFDVETAGDATMSDEDSCDEEYNRVRGRKRGTAAVAGVSDDDNGTSQGANRSRSRRGRWSASQTNMTSSSATSTGIIPSTDGTLDEAAGNDDRTVLNIELDDSELEDVEAAAAEILKRSLSRDE